MTVRTRLLLTSIGISVLLAAPALYGVSRLAALRDIAREQRERHATAYVALGDLQTALADLDRFHRSYLAVPDVPALRNGMHGAIEQARAEVANLRDAGYDGQATDDVDLKLDRLHDAMLSMEMLVGEGRLEQATTLGLEQVQPLLEGATDLLRPIANAIDLRSSNDLDDARRISSVGTSTTLFGVIVSLILAVALGAWTIGALTSPLQRLRDATATVAAGEFHAPPDLPYGRHDEIGDLARSFHAMTQRLAELDRLKAEFVSVASHELKTPINVISGYAELIEDGLYGQLNEEQREILGSIREESHVLGRLVGQLLDISRLEAGRFGIEMQAVRLDELIAGIDRAFQGLAKRKRIHFLVDIDRSAALTLDADPDRLRNEVLGNLLSNAFKFTPDGGFVRVKAWSDPEGARIDVADTGVGIPDDQLPYIFEKYHQVGEQARTMGVGLGLAIAREVVEAHGGSITAESRIGRGTVFHIFLPVRKLVAATAESA